MNPCRALVAMGLALIFQACSSGSTASPATPPSGSPPQAAFTLAPVAPQVGQSVTFHDASTGGPTSWSWIFGDGTSSPQQHPTHTFTASGTYTVSLTAANAAGSSQARQAVVVAPVVTPPKAAFSVTPAAPAVGQSVSFQDASTGTPTSWVWDFGDGTSSPQQNPAHTYATAGTYTVTLTATNAGGSSLASQPLVVAAVPPTPVAAFTLLPMAPVQGQGVTFQDQSTGSPTAWSWNFGDGGTSTQQHPVHAFASAGTFTVSLTASNGAGSNTTRQVITVAPAGDPTAFPVSLVLGSPTATTLRVNVFAPSRSGSVVLQYGLSGGPLDRATTALALTAGIPAEWTLTGLKADARYACQLVFTPPGDGPTLMGPLGSFHTARPTGSTFTFTVQADSHMDENTDPAVYLRALGNVLADGPDFHVDLGDTFMCEKHGEPLSGTAPPAADSATVENRYRYERANFSALSHAVPLFLVNGNHEGEAGWQNTGSANCLAVWATQARQRHFVNPVPDGFYTGDSIDEPFVGKRASYYAWHWGDALFVVLDPFWFTKTQVNRDPWAMTLGDRQYQWLQQTLASSKAPFKFVFIHNLVGGLDGQMRGGIEAAPYFEWGGKNLDGSSAFSQKRPGWSLPLHALFVANRVTAVFHGHDHLYCKQDLDGIVYQEVPQPSAKNFQSGPALAKEYHYASGTILSSSGHLRVTVTPERVTAQYIRVWLPSQENSTRKNGQVEDTWTVSAQSR